MAAKTDHTTQSILNLLEQKIPNDPEGRVLSDALAHAVVKAATTGNMRVALEILKRLDTVFDVQETQQPIHVTCGSREENKRRIKELLSELKNA